jgi:hypothetical protein
MRSPVSPAAAPGFSFPLLVSAPSQARTNEVNHHISDEALAERQGATIRNDWIARGYPPRDLAGIEDPVILLASALG